MKTIYFAAPLFTMAERNFNFSLSQELENLGYKVNLPQTFCEGINGRYLIFAECLSKLDNSDVVVAILDGSDVDSGTAVEIGYAFAKDITVVGVRTDFRKASDGDNGVNIMCDYVCGGLVEYDPQHNLTTLAHRINDVIKELIEV